MEDVAEGSQEEVSYGAAIRSIWLLWSRGKKKLIGQLGLDWNEVNSAFSEFEQTIVRENVKLSGERETKMLLVYLGPELGYKIVEAAVYMIHLYQTRS